MDEACESEELHTWGGDAHLRAVGTEGVRTLWVDGIDRGEDMETNTESRAEPGGIPTFKHQVMGEMAMHVGRDPLGRWKTRRMWCQGCQQERVLRMTGKCPLGSATRRL